MSRENFDAFLSEKIKKELENVVMKDEIKTNIKEKVAGLDKVSKIGEKSMKSSKKNANRFVVAAASVACLLGVSVTGVVAYNGVMKRLPEQSNVFTQHFDKEDASLKVQNNVEFKTEENSNYDIIWDGYMVGDTHIHANLTLKSKDNKRIIPVSDTKAPIRTTLGFSNVNVKLDDETVMINGKYIKDLYTSSSGTCNFFYVGESEDGTTVNMEMVFTTPDKSSLTAKKMEVEFGDLICSYNNFESSDSDATVYDIVKDMKLASENDFTMQEGLDTKNNIYNLAAGDNKVYFSKNFPNSYIDNAGYIRQGYNNDLTFVMAITSPEEERDGLLDRICFRNKLSDHSVTSYARQMEDGRVVIFYDVNNDMLSYGDLCKTGKETVDVNDEFLKNITIRSYSSENSRENKVVVLNNSADATFNLENKIEGIKLEKELTVPVSLGSETNMTVKGVRCDGMTFTMEIEKLENPMLMSLVPVITLKDGSVCEFMYKGGNWTYSNGNMVIDYQLENFVNPDDIASIEVNKVKVY